MHPRIVSRVLVALSIVVTAVNSAPVKPRPLEFHLAEPDRAKGLIRMRIEGRTGFIYLHPKIELDDRDIERAVPVKGQLGEPAVQVKLTSSGFSKMRDLTRKYQKRMLAIVASGKVVATPIIIGEQVDELLDIEGSFTQEETEALAAALNTKQ
jgi:preprotein translocase subunit SecD